MDKSMLASQGRGRSEWAQGGVAAPKGKREGEAPRSAAYGTRSKTALCAGRKADRSHCGARRALGTRYCIGHLRSMGKA
jgi:hypothetical protein